MDWKDLLPFIVVLGVMGTMWWQLGSRIDRLMTILIDMKGEIGDLKGQIGEVKGQMTSVQSQAHTHTAPQ